jgi:hypothetical protein
VRGCSGVPMEKISLSLNKPFYHTLQNDCGRRVPAEKMPKRKVRI